MRNDVNLNRSLIVKGWRSIDRLHNIHYQTFRNGHHSAPGQRSCQSINNIHGGEGGRGAGFG